MLSALPRFVRHATARTSCPLASPQGFPSIFFFAAVPAGEKKVAVTYEGERDEAGFLAFLKKQAANKGDLAAAAGGAAAVEDDEESDDEL